MKIILFICTVILCSCNVKNKQFDGRIQIERFPIENNVLLDSFKIEPVLYCVGDLLVNNDILISIDLKNEMFFQFFKLPDFKYLGSSIMRGGGPNNEMMIFPNLQNINDTLWAYRTVNHQKIVSYNVKQKKINVIKDISIPNEYLNVVNSSLINEENYL